MKAITRRLGRVRGPASHLFDLNSPWPLLGRIDAQNRAIRLDHHPRMCGKRDLPPFFAWMNIVVCSALAVAVEPEFLVDLRRAIVAEENVLSTKFGLMAKHGYLSHNIGEKQQVAYFAFSMTGVNWRLPVL